MIPKSKELRFETTTKCNYNCLSCPRDKFSRKITTMSLQEYAYVLNRILEEHDQFDTITFSGIGEPLLDETLLNKIHYAKSKNDKIKVSILLTNGYLLDPKKFDDLKKVGIDSVRFSIYGANRQTYKKVHSFDGFDKVLKNLTYIHKNKGNIKVGLTYLILKGINDMEVESWKYLFEPLADYIDIWKPHNWSDLEKFRDVSPNKKNSCGRPFNTPIQVLVNFDVSVCCFDYNGQLVIGNLMQNSLAEIFDSKKYHEIIKQHSTGNYTDTKLPCTNCDQRNAEKKEELIYSSYMNREDRVHKTSTSLENMDQTLNEIDINGEKL